MTNVCKLTFQITCNVADELADDLGKDLAHWLLCEWFNGEDVLDIEYVSHEVIH